MSGSFSFTFFTFLDQSEFQLPNIFNNHEVLTTEADYYCLQQMKLWLTMEIRKKSAFIEFCQECLNYNRILYITGDVLLLYDFYMNDEERQSYTSDQITISQINRLKLRLRQDRFQCKSPERLVYRHEQGTDLILVERFSRA